MASTVTLDWQKTFGTKEVIRTSLQQSTVYLPVDYDVEQTVDQTMKSVAGTVTKIVAVSGVVVGGALLAANIPGGNLTVAVASVGLIVASCKLWQAGNRLDEWSEVRQQEKDRDQQDFGKY